jgi:hypothetical protein
LSVVGFQLSEAKLAARKRTTDNPNTAKHPSKENPW